MHKFSDFLAIFFTITITLYIPVLSAAEQALENPYPDKIKVRIGTYIVDRASTNVRINSTSSANLGTIIDYKRDLGAEDSQTIPRLDAYYRFNDKHRIDYTYFSLSRAGSTTLSLDLSIKDVVFSAFEAVNSNIKFTLHKIGYSYSFYHTPDIELGFTTGLNITTYDLSFVSTSSSTSETAGVTAPLPMFGLRMEYMLSPKWRLHYLNEAFYIESEGSFKGAFINYELDIEYQLSKNFGLGLGVARFSVDVDVFDDDFNGSITDSYRGLLLQATLNF